MIQFSPKKKTATIEHPGNANIKPGEIKLTVTKPSRVDQQKLALSYADANPPELAINPETGRPYLDGKGQALTMQRPQQFQFDLMVEYIADHVEHIAGMEMLGEDNAPRSYSADTRTAMISELVEEPYDVKVHRTFPVLDEQGQPTGKTEEREIDIAFLHYVLERLNDRETFANPLETRSSDSSSAN